MNPSNLLNLSRDEENEEILYIMNYLFDVFKSRKLENFSDILDEKIIKLLIEEIEPEIENITEKLNIVYNDKSFGIRYGNFMNIIILLQNYFEFKKKTDLLIFTEKLKIKEKLVVNDLLKEDEKSLRNFIYIFIVMSSISSKKDTYIDRISETEERYMDKYLSIIEKYITVEYPSNNESEPVNRNITKRLTLRKSTTINSFSLENNLAFINSNKNTNLLKQEISNYENVKANLQSTIEELKLENDELRNKNCILNEKIELVTTKQNEMIKELEIAKSSQVNRDDIFNDLLLINSLKTTIAQKELEVEDVKKDYQQNVKNYLDKIAKNKKKREQVSSALGEKTSECLELKTENDKLKAKLKESQTLKEKVTDYESLRVQISVQKNQINDMKIEKSSLETHISNLSNEISQEKEQSRRNVYLKEFAENKVIDLQSEINSLKETMKNREKMNNPLIKKKSTLNMQSQEFLKIEQNQQNLYELENEYLIDEMQKEFEEKTENFLKEIEDLKNKILPLEQEKSKLEEENQTMKEKLEYLESNILQIRNENEKILFEKEKIEVSVKKIELEYKMQIFYVEKEKETLEMKHSHNLMKLEEISKLKEFLNNELEKSREQLNNSNTNLERVTREKFELLKELERYKSDSNMKKIELEKEILTLKDTNQNLIKEKESLVLKNKTLNELKQEISNLESDSDKKNEKIKNLNEKISQSEKENKNLLSKIQENLKLYNIEIKQRKDDFEFLKKAYEDQKIKIKNEHNMLTNSMYEVVQEFLGMKTELNKKAEIRRLEENENYRTKSFSISK